MKNILYTIILCFLFSSSVFATDYDWEKAAKDNTPNINLTFNCFDIIYGSDNQKVPLYQQLISNLDVRTHRNDGITLNDENYFMKNGCRAHSCPETGIVWIDKKKNIFVGLVVHKCFEDDKVDESVSWFDIPNNYLFFSKSIDTFDEIPKEFMDHFAALEKENSMLDKKKGYGNPEKVRFIGADNKIIDVTKEYGEK